MTTTFDWAPTVRIMAVAVVLYAIVWAAPLLSRRLVAKKTLKILKAARPSNVNQKNISKQHASDQQTT